MVDYSAIASDAAAVIKDAGQSITIKFTSGETFDPATGKTTGGTETSGTFEAAVVPATPDRDGRFFGETLVRESMRKLVIAPGDFVPKAGYTAVFEGAEWTLMGVTPVNPAGTPVVYIAGAKK